MAKLEMDVINTHCAGIDIGSRFHFVAVGQRDDDVKEFSLCRRPLRYLHVTNKDLVNILSPIEDIKDFL
jgi:hypothetical protein